MNGPRASKKVKQTFTTYDGRKEVFVLEETRTDRIGNKWETYRTPLKPERDGDFIVHKQYTHEVYTPALSPPSKTQGYARLGYELLGLMNLIDNYYCTLPNGTEGFLLPREEIAKLKAYIEWAFSRTGLKGRPQLSLDRQIFDLLRLRDQVDSEQKKRGCSRTEAIQEVTKKLGKHSWQALEKEISDSRFQALGKRVLGGARAEQVDAFCKKMEMIRREIGAPTSRLLQQR
jgi:hypothetical protein